MDPASTTTVMRAVSSMILRPLWRMDNSFAGSLNEARRSFAMRLKMFTVNCSCSKQ